MSNVIHICSKCSRRAAESQYDYYDEITGFQYYFCFPCYTAWDHDWVKFLEENSD